ncbi:YjbF family lipoprotein [Vibrio sinaloensis]|nr:YjbF family lipoprotein [Vibrio sinaloensis]
MLFVLLLAVRNDFKMSTPQSMKPYSGLMTSYSAQRKLSNFHTPACMHVSMMAHKYLWCSLFVDINPVTGNKQLKWLSSDSAMITTENGRIVKTTHLPDANLAGLSASNALTSPTAESTSWQSEYDWQPDYHYGKKALVDSFPAGFETVQSLLWEKKKRA